MVDDSESCEALIGMDHDQAIVVSVAFEKLHRLLCEALSGWIMITMQLNVIGDSESCEALIG